MEGYHFFGTDASGRDLLVRTAIGGRISLLVGIAGAFISVTIGTIYGAISGYVGGKTDMLMMRFLEILSSFPFMFFVILLVTLCAKHFLNFYRNRSHCLAWSCTYRTRTNPQPKK